MKTECRSGHALPENARPGRPGSCAVCHRDRERARRRARGAKPYVKPTACPQGHPYPESLRSSGHGCAVCHNKEAQAYYRANLDERRAWHCEFAMANRAKAQQRHKTWRDANRQHVRIKALEGFRRRQVGRDGDSAAYSEIIRRDPCSYCGQAAGTVDHITALVAGGSSDWSNLTAACKSCNSRKRATDLLQFLSRRPLPDMGVAA